MSEAQVGTVEQSVAVEHRTDKRHVLFVTEAYGTVALTKGQRDLLLSVVVGKRCGALNSTQELVSQKILAATGWEEMKFTQLACRFCYKHKLVEV